MLGMCSIGNDNAIECYNDAAIPWPNRPKKKFTVAVDGNIGSGKSTFLNYFANSPNVAIVSEPVEMWKNVNGNNVLDLMYRDPSRWAFTFQSLVQRTMCQVHAKKTVQPVKIMERTIYSAQYCFVENLYRGGHLNHAEFAILQSWFEWNAKNYSNFVDLMVYLRASPETCLERIRSRGRAEEASITLEYLETLHELHENWLIKQHPYKAPAPVLIFDANKSLGKLKIDFEKHRADILCGYV